MLQRGDDLEILARDAVARGADALGMAGGDGSLEAFIDGYERRIDLGLVNGRVFVNNVSLGVYAEIVQSDAYRDQKLKTAGDMLPELFGPESEKFDFDLESADGPIDDACMVLVSNNVYELERLAGFGTRVRIDEGVLGSFSGWHHWSVPVLEVQSSGDIKAGVDGEALVLPAPLRFEIVSASH